MLCQQCHERNATIHLSFIVGDKMTKRDLCEVCGAEYADPANFRKSIDLRTFTAGGPDQMISQLIVASLHGMPWMPISLLSTLTKALPKLKRFFRVWHNRTYFRP